MIIGIDLGGSKIAGAVVRDGRIARRARRMTESAKGRAHVIAQMRAVIDELAGSKRVTAVGIGVPGVVSGTKIIRLPNLSCLDGVDLKKALRLRCPLVLDNDARCFAFGEFRHGAGKGTTDMIGVTLGTGLGCGIVAGGRSLRGAHGAAGEAGHQISDTSVRRFDVTKHRDEWEALLSGRAILARYRAFGGKGERATDVWVAKDSAARKTRDETARLLAIFIANLAITLDPDKVVLGGGAANSQLVKDTNRWLPRFGCRPMLSLSRLREDAAIFGAAVMAKG